VPQPIQLWAFDVFEAVVAEVEVKRLARLLIVFFALGLTAPEARASGEEQCQTASPKKPSRGKKAKRAKKPKGDTAQPEVEEKEEATPAETEPATKEEEGAGAVVEPTFPEVERKVSAVTPGTLSRWSNAGAMTPVVAEVPVTAPLPERAVPIQPGAPTPGQRLLDDDEQLTAHLSLYGEHLQTVRQDDRDLNLARGRATLSYDRIGGSEFGANVDLEYRSTVTGPRRTDRRINAAYVSWGLTDFRRQDGPDLGLAIGRVAVREAGYAQADGAAIRFRAMPELSLGFFGGFTGNPYNYNWKAGETEDFSTDWLTGGAFAGVRLPGFFADLAAVATYSSRGLTGLDRLHAFLDTGYSVSDEIDLFFTGWFDMLETGQPLQNVELMGIWAPSREANVRLSLGRFSTVAYDVSQALSFRFDPQGNRLSGGLSQAVDENGLPIVPFDAALQIATYNEVQLRAGYRFGAFEPYAAIGTLIRDPGASPANVQFATLRLQPAAGVLYRDPDLFDVSAQAMGIIDDQTERRAVLSLGVSRAFEGLSIGADARAFVGGIGALDGGLDLGYSLPREWMPGRLMLRAMFRYFREDATLVRPKDICFTNPAADPASCDRLAETTVLPAVVLQESFLGFAGVDWRL
jgi:hypothetical protein